MRGHGTVRRYASGCRCETCVLAQRKYVKVWAYEAARGMKRTVPVEDVRPALQRLIDAGWTRQAIYRATGVSCASQRAILGMGSREGGPQRSVKRTTAERILALDTRPRLLPTNTVPARGTVLRIRALMAIGWRVEDLNKLTGGNCGTVLHREHEGVTVSTRDRVREVYDRLWSTPGPSPTNRRLGRKRGWLPPLALDDDRLDDQEYTPDGSALRTPTARVRVDLAEVDELMSLGLDLQQAADRLGLDRETVRKALARRTAAAS